MVAIEALGQTGERREVILRELPRKLDDVAVGLLLNRDCGGAARLKVAPHRTEPRPQARLDCLLQRVDPGRPAGDRVGVAEQPTQTDTQAWLLWSALWGTRR